jgi:hypothetical protein
MATCKEMPLSEGSNYNLVPAATYVNGQGSRERKYKIVGSGTVADALSILHSTAPGTIGTIASATDPLLFKENMAVEVKHFGADAASCVWEGTVRYGPWKSGYSFSTSGGTVHVSQGLKNGTHNYPNDANTPDFEDAINVEADNVNGVDIVSSVFNFTETHTFVQSAVTEAYQSDLATVTGTVNNASFRGFAAGEVLFLGVDGNLQGSGDWTLTFKFSVSKNQTNLSVGSLTGIAKAGWDYMWVKYKKSTSAGHPVQIPAFVYVNRVYIYTDFSLLDLGS